MERRIRTAMAGLAMAATMMVPSMAWAGSTPSNVVALGDSITFGYNLSDTANNTKPSQEAFPFVLSKKLGDQAYDLGVPGWTSTQLLNALRTDTSMRSTVQKANVVTIDIGSNDLIQAAENATQESALAGLAGLESGGNSVTQTVEQTLTQTMEKAIQQLSSNLNQILNMVHALNPNAQVVLYNIYNPFPSPNEVLFYVAQQVIPEANVAIANVAADHNLPVANAYLAFTGHPGYILNNDIHPTIAGQEALAAAGEKDLEILKIEDYVGHSRLVQSWITWFAEQLANVSNG